MSMLRRTLSRETKPAPAPPPVDPAIAAALQRQIDDPSTGEIRRNQLRRRLDPRLRDGRAFGPSAAPTPPPQPEARMSDNADLIAHHEDVAREIHEVDKFAKQVEERIAALGGSPDRAGLADLRVKLKILRREIEHDLLAWPAVNALPHQHKFIAIRARELRSMYWASADRLRRESEPRHAITATINSLRARMCAEHEMGLRPHLSGY